MKIHSNRWLVAAAAALFAVGCAQSNGDINRVQPNVVKKADLLDGVWYFRNTVTWTPATTGFTFPGQTGTLEKLVFEIQERNLVGYRAYPYILGAENNIDAKSQVTGTTAKYCNAKGECTGGQPYYGAPVVAFPIQGHFDIQRGYNPVTGETNNVISENATDRFWNEREYMRVDWSANVLNMFSGMNWGTVQNPIGGSSQASWIQPNEKGENPMDWPSREYTADGKLNYFDYTGRYVANPDTVYFEGWGNIPYCWFRGYEQYDCSSSEIKMRLSFAKVDPIKSRDYQPLQYDNDLMSKFGYFRVERLNYDRKFGYNNSAVIRLATRFNTWESSLNKDASGNPDPNNPIPFAQRTVKPIKYYFTRAENMGGQENYDEYMVPGRRIEKNWDKAFRRAVAAAQGKSPDQVGQVFHICNNPVREGDPAACGAAGFSPKFGDLRYSFVNVIAEPVANGLLGYGPSSPDPETGELISANSNTYLWGVDAYGRSLLDTIDLLNGDATVTEYISGQQVRDYIANNPVYTKANAGKKTGGLLQAENQDVVQSTQRSVGSFDKFSTRSLGVVQKLKATGGLPKTGGDAARTAADTLAKHPQLESLILDNPDVKDSVIDLLPPEVQARAAADKEYARKVSRMVLTNPRGAHEFEKRRIDFASKNNLYLAEFFDRTLYALANKESQRRADRVAALVGKAHPKCADVNACTAREATLIANDEISMRIRQGVWQATTEHEIGHTIGLRHNFQGSFDAINYFDSFWDVKAPSLTMQQAGVNKLPRTPADLLAAATPDNVALARGLYDAQYSSIMDYSAKAHDDWQGVGKYDEAAIIFAYSGDTSPGYVEVFENARANKLSFPGTDGKMVEVTGARLDLPLVNAQRKHPGARNYTERYHYTLAPLHFGEGNELGVVMSDGIKKFGQRKLMKWADVKKENDRVAAAIEANPNIVNDPDANAAAIGNAPLEVPYMFCTDDHVGAVLSCNRFDKGPDYFEIARQEIEDYWNYYFSTHFRRDRYRFSTGAAFNGAFSTFYTISNIYKHWVFESYGKASSAQALKADVKLDPTFQDYWTMGVLDGINAHLNVMAVPPHGVFMLRNLNGRAQWDIISSGDEFDKLNDIGKKKLTDYYARNFSALDFAELPRGLGRSMNNRWDYKSGFQFQYRVIEAGHYNDVIGALFAAVLPEADFLGVDFTADFNRFNIPYYLVFKDEMTNVFSSLWAYNEELVRPTLFFQKDEGGTVTRTAGLANRVFVRGQDFVSGFNYPKDAQVGLTALQKPGQANIQPPYISRLYALYLGEALFRVNYDLDYAKANQIYKLGGAEQMTVGPGFHTVEVEDIVTGAKYAAIEQDGVPPPTAADQLPSSTPAVRVINIAKAYLEVVKNPAMCPLPPYLSYVGWTCMPADEAGNAALVQDRRILFTDIFQNYIRDLDTMRGMYQAYGSAF